MGSWGVVWLAWMREISLPTERGRFFSCMRFSVRLFNISTLTFFSLIIGSKVTAPSYNLLLLLACLALAFVQVSRLPESLQRQTVLHNEEHSSSPPGSLRRESKQLLCNNNYLLLMLMHVMNKCVGVPLLALYAGIILHCSARAITLQLTLRSLAIPGSLLLWGKSVDRVGVRRVLFWTVGGFALVLPCWFLVAPQDGHAAMLLSLMACVSAGDADRDGGRRAEQRMGRCYADSSAWDH